MSMALPFFAMSANAQTTAEDYAYLSQGMIADALKGVKLNANYTAGTTRTWNTPVGIGSDGKRTTVTSVIRRSTNNTPVGIFVALKRSDTQYERTICIPLPSSDERIRTQAWNDFLKATPEWNYQAQTYCWQLALSFVAEVEEQGAASTKAIGHVEPVHPIDTRLEQCRGKVNADDFGMVHPEYGCYYKALTEWKEELKRLQEQLLAQVDDKAEFVQKFAAWDTYFTESIEAESQMSSLQGSIHQTEILDASIQLMKARVEMLKTYLNIIGR